MSGTLYLCPTPIGNLEDITVRVRRVLGEVSVIAAEDTRRTRILLNHIGVKARLVSYHDHNAAERIPVLLATLEGGGDVALVSEAGTPALADPGFKLVGAAIDAGLAVVSLPGASAVTTALVVSGLPTDAFLFAGFLPRKRGERAHRLETLGRERHTVVIFESPRRVVGVLRELAESWGPRPCALCRELTKLHEEILRGSLEEVADLMERRETSEGTIKGEIVVVIGGATGPEAAAEFDAGLARALVVGLSAEGRTRSEALALAARHFGVSKNELYARTYKR